MRSKTASGCSKDFNGHITTFNYDVMNRLLSKTPDPVLAEPTVSFTYFPTGQRQSMSDATGVTTYGYDNRDRLLEKATPQGTLTYTWDAGGNVTSIVSSNVGGTNVQYTWDENNRLKDVIDVHAGMFTYAYDDLGNETGLSYPNGIQKTTTYDAQNRLRTIGYVNGVSTVASYAYALDVTGRRTGVVEHSGRTVQYGYDALYRLTSEEVTADPDSINGRVVYRLDAAGNRLARTSTLAPLVVQAETFNANDQGTSELYDLNGNLIRDGNGDVYSWDAENHLASKNGVWHTRAYNADGVLVGKTDDTLTTRYLVDDVNPTGYSQVLEEVTGSSFALHTFGMSVIASLVDGTATYLLSDGQGSVREVVNGGGDVVALAGFDAYGVAVWSNGEVGRYRYAGERWDDDLGAAELRARHYRVETGTFLTADPVQHAPESMEVNRYNYARSDPVNRADPTGEESILSVMSVVDMIGTLVALSPAGNSGLTATGAVATKRIDIVQMSTSYNIRDPEADVAEANAIYSQCRPAVRFEIDQRVRLTSEEQRGLGIGGNNFYNLTDRQEDAEGRSPRAMRGLVEHARIAYGLRNVLQAFYVQELASRDNGVTVLAADIGPAIFIANSAQLSTLAHEIGHVYIQREHSTDPSNLMVRGGLGRDLTPLQCLFARSGM